MSDQNKQETEPNEQQRSQRQSFCKTLVQNSFAMNFMPRTKPELLRNLPQDPLNKETTMIKHKIVHKKKREKTYALPVSVL